MTAAVLAGLQTLLIPNIGEFQIFAKLLMIFVEFWSKFTKFLGNPWISSQVYLAFSTGFPMLSIGGVWIFSGIAYYSEDFCVQWLLFVFSLHDVFVRGHFDRMNNIRNIFNVLT